MSSHLPSRRSLSRKIGEIVERVLKKILVEHGFVVARIAGSGYGKFPDLIALRKGQVFLLEVKYRQTHNYVSLSEQELQKLKAIRELTGFNVYIVVKFGNDDFYVIELDKIPRSTKGHYIIRKRDLMRIGIKLSDWLKLLAAT